MAKSPGRWRRGGQIRVDDDARAIIERPGAEYDLEAEAETALLELSKVRDTQTAMRFVENYGLLTTPPKVDAWEKLGTDEYDRADQEDTVRERAADLRDVASLAGSLRRNDEAELRRWRRAPRNATMPDLVAEAKHWIAGTVSAQARDLDFALVPSTTAGLFTWKATPRTLLAAIYAKAVEWISDPRFRLWICDECRVIFYRTDRRRQRFHDDACGMRDYYQRPGGLKARRAAQKKTTRSRARKAGRR